MNSLETEVDESVMYAKLTTDVWKDLEDRFAQSNASCIFLDEKVNFKLKSREFYGLNVLHKAKIVVG